MAQPPIFAFVDPDTDFDLATTAILDTAYDHAIAELRNRGPNSVREAVARRIVTLASAGERDPNRLCDKALLSVGYFS